ncbi:MAG: mechanosensitive ion channel [Gammaproteobacteria bacterium]|jgi:small-conductance mechanosensitive channel
MSLFPGGLCVFLALIALLPAVCGAAATATGDDWLNSARHALSDARRTLQTFNPHAGDTDALDLWDRTLGEIRVNAQNCVSARQQAIANLKGTPSPAAAASGGTPAVSRDTRRRLDELGAQLTACQNVLLEARSLGDQIRSAREQVLKLSLLARGADIWSVAVVNVQAVGSLPGAVRQVLLDRVRVTRLSASGWGLVAILSTVAVGLGLWWRRTWRARLRRRQGEGARAGLSVSLQACLARRLPLMLGLAAAAGALLLVLPAGPIAPTEALLVSMLVYIAGVSVVRALLSPCPPAAHYLAIEPAYAGAMYRRIHGLLFLMFLAILIFITGIRSTIEVEHWYLIRAALFVAATVQLVWVVSTLRGIPPPLSNPRLRGLAVLVLVAGLVIELLGFRNLSLYLFRGVLGTGMLGVGLWLLNSLLQDGFDGVDSGRYAWQRQLRERLSLKEGEPVPGLIWLRFLTVLLIWLAFGVTVVGLWGYSATFWSLVRQGISEGFQLGPVRINPINWVVGIVVFSVLVALVRWIRNEVLPAWISKARIERGAREAVVTISGYVGVIIAAIIGLSLAGFSFNNLAIIAGALSVGIGFGLQNIVNNFVSGIILLFERPIRTGDWIVVGGTEGYVRKISIRSTQIETFDRADVIVPNSELISGQVTNWMLRDSWGRVIAPVGVAYGSDVEKVREVLLQAAREHPLVMADSSRVSQPRVLFRGFGDSSLNFELRCFIRNVDQRLGTLSDLNFAIEKGLREAGIEIPFPQRDLHLRSVDSSVRFGPGAD